MVYEYSPCYLYDLEILFNVACFHSCCYNFIGDGSRSRIYYKVAFSHSWTVYSTQWLGQLCTGQSQIVSTVFTVCMSHHCRVASLIRWSGQLYCTYSYPWLGIQCDVIVLQCSVWLIWQHREDSHFRRQRIADFTCTYWACYLFNMAVYR